MSCRSMYFDEDGELAHEFYEEVKPKRPGGRRKVINKDKLVFIDARAREV